MQCGWVSDLKVEKKSICSFETANGFSDVKKLRNDSLLMDFVLDRSRNHKGWDSDAPVGQNIQEKLKFSNLHEMCLCRRIQLGYKVSNLYSLFYYYTKMNFMLGMYFLNEA